MAALDQQLADGLHQLALTLSPAAQQQLLAYLQLLQKWNQAYNLTAVRDPAQMLSRHLLDSLAVAPLLQGHHFADIGTGAGLPGIPLAMALPDRQFVLVDSNGKKIRFVTQAIAETRLGNASALQQRVEAWQPERLFDGVLSRAFTSLQQMIATCAHLLAPGGRFYALKGIYPEAELSAVPKPYIVEACHPLRVPGDDAQRHLVVIARRD